MVSNLVNNVQQDIKWNSLVPKERGNDYHDFSLQKLFSKFQDFLIVGQWVLVNSGGDSPIYKLCGYVLLSIWFSGSLVWDMV